MRWKNAKCQRSYRASVLTAMPVLLLSQILLGGVQPSSPSRGDTRKSERADKYIWRSQLTATVRGALSALGDRLEKRGKERVTFQGTLTLTKENLTVPVLLIRENPRFLHLVIGQGEGTSVIRFDGNRVITAGHLDSGLGAKLLELLAEDTVEQFFYAQQRGFGTRYLGKHFKLDGPVPLSEKVRSYFVYLVRMPDQFSSGPAFVNKSYCFNTESGLLQRLRYRLNRTEIEVLFTRWGYVGDQMLPGRIVRLEDSKSVIDLRFTSAQVGTTLDDGLF